jgi:hypothetical protein
VDPLQRSAFFLDTLRERGENMLEHERQGLPPLLHFEHEKILDAREFEQPVNYALLRIQGGREKTGNSRRRDSRARPPIVEEPTAPRPCALHGGFEDLRDSVACQCAACPAIPVCPSASLSKSVAMDS